MIQKTIILKLQFIWLILRALPMIRWRNTCQNLYSDSVLMSVHKIPSQSDNFLQSLLLPQNPQKCIQKYRHQTLVASLRGWVLSTPGSTSLQRVRFRSLPWMLYVSLLCCKKILWLSCIWWCSLFLGPMWYSVVHRIYVQIKKNTSDMVMNSQLIK